MKIRKLEKNRSRDFFLSFSSASDFKSTAVGKSFWLVWGSGCRGTTHLLEPQIKQPFMHGSGYTEAAPTGTFSNSRSGFLNSSPRAPEASSFSISSSVKTLRSHTTILSLLQLSVQFSCSAVSDSATLWTVACQASLSTTNSWSLLRLMSIKLVMPSNHLILCCPLLLLPSIFPSIRVSSKESVLPIRWPKQWCFGFSISSSGLIFRMDWFDLLAVQGTLKSLLQHHSSKPSIHWCLAFFITQLSHPCMTTGKAIALTRWTFVGKVMSLLFNMLSRLAIAFLPRSNVF